jgi:lambda family phage portal protein
MFVKADPKPDVPWYESLIARHAPLWAAQRDYYRTLRSAQRSAQASVRGGVSTRTSESYERLSGLKFDSSVNRAVGLSARDRGRQAYDNNPVAESLIDTETDNVVAEGFTLQAKTQDDAFNDEAEERFAEWFDNADLRGQDEACSFQRMIWRSSRIDGDGAVLLVDAGAGGESKLQYIPSDWIKTPDGKSGSRDYIDGVQIDSVGRPVQFWFLDLDEYGKRKFSGYQPKDVLFLSHRKKSTAIRGETCYKTIFEWLNHLDQYVDGVALAAWMATVFGLVFKEKAAGASFQQLGTSLTNSVGDLQKAITLENGSVKFVGPEASTVQVDAKQPMQQTPDFIRMMFRLIGLPFQMPLELALKDVSQSNLSSLRGARQDYYRSCRPKQIKFVAKVLRPIYRWWVSREVKIGGGVGRNDRFVSKVPALYQTHQWQPRGWEFSDPITEAQAALLEIDMGINSPQNVTARLGRDYDTIQEQISLANQDREAKGLHNVRSTLTRDPISADSVDAGGAAPAADETTNGDTVNGDQLGE